ncbi:hypothetical protein LEP1GSC161_3290 [Leptospira santarosai str. CBC1416]|uniref:Uncharacterized protein n=1 Tax=Leptospira santarosai str. CBC1416 TaxID=1193059 RepID=M6VNH5_9LEPT|nr:hypothetical protein LEP1GSC068_1371 [Leptospira sp. Fiocruz LV3954]EMO58360.1 hypothetical protein LEP1GSC161_3290 [Leptospira santarosai str. CBC1416]
MRSLFFLSVLLEWSFKIFLNAICVLIFKFALFEKLFKI